MAIVIEEEKQASSGAWVAVLLWMVFIVALAAGFYYVFVKKPDLVPIATPADFKSTEQISKLPLDPGKVTESPQFKSLKIQINETEIGNTGRNNPFLGL